MSVDLYGLIGSQDQRVWLFSGLFMYQWHAQLQIAAELEHFPYKIRGKSLGTAVLKHSSWSSKSHHPITKITVTSRVFGAGRATGGLVNQKYIILIDSGNSGDEK